MESLLSIVFSFLTTISFALPFQMIDTAEIAAKMSERGFIEKITATIAVFAEKLSPYGMLVFFLCLFFYTRVRKKAYDFSLSALVLSSFFSVFCLIGECASQFESLSPIFFNIPQILLSLLKFAGRLLFFYSFLRWAYALIDEHKQSDSLTGFAKFVFEKHCFLLPALFILLSFLPYVIAFFPGFVPSDGLKQLNNFFGHGHFTDNHPAFSTMLMGWAMRTGKALGSDNIGLFLFTGPQLLITVCSLAYTFKVYKLLKTPLLIRVLTLVSFCLLPFRANYAYSLLKDTLYIDMLLLYVLQLIRILRDDEYFKHWGNMLLLFGTVLLMMLMRHEGKFFIALSFPWLFLYPRCHRQLGKLLPQVILAFMLVICFNKIIRPALKIADSPAREALTMEFRQSAAVILRHGEKLTTEEDTALRRAFSEYEKIPICWTIHNGDYMKGLFDPYADSSAVRDYLRTWAKMGLKYPLTYLDVFFSASYRYLWPLGGVYRDIYGWFGIEKADYVNLGLFDLSYPPQFSGFRSILTNLANAAPHLPFFGLFYSLGLNLWVFLSCLGYQLRRKVRGNIIPLLPVIFSSVCLLNTAINGFFRYALPIITLLPVVIAWTITGNQKD